MMQSIYLKTLYDKRWFIVGWFLGFGVLAVLMVIFYPAMNQDGSLDQLVKSMPPAMQGLVGDLMNLREFSTYLASQLFDIRLQLISGVMIVILALSLTVAEEETGQLRTIASLPISRVSILLQKWLAMITIIFVTHLGVVAGILLFQGTIGESMDIGGLTRLFVMTILVVAALGSIIFALGMATGVRALTSGLGIIALAGSFIITTFAAGVDWLKDYEMWSLFYYFPPVAVVKDGIAVENVTILGLLLLVSLVIAVFGFRRRDIKA